MWRADGPPRPDLPDLSAFLDLLDRQGDFFERDEPVFVARAPGCLNVMGGIAEHSGSLVLALPLAAATLVAAQPADDGAVTVRGLPPAAGREPAEVRLPLAELAPGGSPLEYGVVRGIFGADPSRQRAARAAGALLVLARERGRTLERGLRLLVDSTVPAGKGAGSSAALAVAALLAVSAALGLRLEGREVTALCQKLESLVVDGDCGTVELMTAAGGEAGRLVAVLCQPAEPEPGVPLPAELEVWGIHSGIDDAASSDDYSRARTGAFMGYRILADVAGLNVSSRGDGRVHVDDPRWRYLANVTPSEWDSRFRDAVPVEMNGAAFLERYGGVTDPVSRVEPERSYAVRQPTAHAIDEHHRVRVFRALLDGAGVARPDEGRCLLLGEQMYASHASYRACGLGSDATDRLVGLVRAAGPAAGLYGARIAGGATVAILARRGARDVVAGLAERHARETGRAATVIGGSSPGAGGLGCLRAEWSA